VDCVVLELIQDPVISFTISSRFLIESLPTQITNLAMYHAFVHNLL
jgi:hypothetical protein